VNGQTSHSANRFMAAAGAMVDAKVDGRPLFDADYSKVDWTIENSDEYLSWAEFISAYGKDCRGVFAFHWVSHAAAEVVRCTCDALERKPPCDYHADHQQVKDKDCLELVVNTAEEPAVAKWLAAHCFSRPPV
jgi:hypothetical protein